MNVPKTTHHRKARGLKTVLIPARVLIQGHGKDEDKPEATGQTIPSTTWLGRKN
ncbi:hypothetical protein ACFVZM_34610 [Streptomyces sioyaensis]|uniref:hypothetical protein n=1 Tax=Streptomyces sioyaensis TaxID=67364 RepID=UPI0036B34972